MANQEKAAELQGRQNGVILNIASDIRGLKEKMEGGGLSKVEEDKIFAAWEESIVKLETIAGETEDAPVEPPVEG